MRKTLCNNRARKSSIDMAYVYEQIDAGRSVKSLAEELHVSRSTLYRHHKKYQEEHPDTQEENPF